MKYLTIKRNLNRFGVQGYEYLKLGNILSTSIWLYFDSKRKTILAAKNLTKLIIWNFFTIEISSNRNSSIIFILSELYYKRPDYKESYDNVINLIDEQDKLKIIPNRNMEVSFKKLFNLYLNFLKFQQIKGLSLLEKMFFFSEYAKIKSLINILDNSINKSRLHQYKLVVTLCDAHQIDNLVAQFFIENKIKTATLQHAHFTYYDKGYENKNTVHYENFISNYILVWGKFTANEFSKKAGIDRNRIIVAGPPKYINLKLPNKEDALFQKNRNSFGLLLDGDIFQGDSRSIKRNANLIKMSNLIAKRLDLKYIIKFHPNNTLDDYKAVINPETVIGLYKNELSIRDYVNYVDFSILYKTGVYIELLMLLSPFFRLSERCNEFFDFKDIDDFILKYYKLLSNKKVWLSKIENTRKYYSHCINIEDNYKSFFNNFGGGSSRLGSKKY